MPQLSVATTKPDSVELCYDTFGDSSDPPLLLVMGLGTQMIGWQEDFCRMIAARGRFVIRYDNRDVGLSTKLDDAHVDTMAVLGAVLSGQPLPPVPYTLSDMANDAVGLLDALGIAQADVVGASMGGMIAQTIAIEHPSRVRSLVSIMSSPGDPRVGKPTPEALAVLMTPPATDRDGALDRAASALVVLSKRYGSVERARQLAGEAYDRSNYSAGVARQLAAIYASGDRTEQLQRLTVPTLVIHGRDDTLITPDAAEATAAAIPSSMLLMVADMGHDLPEELWPVLTQAIVSAADIPAGISEWSQP